VNRQERQTFTQAILTRVFASPNIPSLRMGEISDVGSTPTVILDGESDARQANQLGDQAGPGERVWCLLWKSVCLVLGRAGGARLLGYTDATSTDTFTTAEVLDSLTVDVVVTQPGRVLRVEAQGLFTVDTNGAQVIMRIRQDGTNLQRIGQHNFPNSTDSEVLNGFGYVEDLSPGGYTFDVTGECSGGTGTFAGATSPGRLMVHDAGPVL
jgi:hypothetical protein